MTSIETISLFYSEGSSNKEYHAEIVQVTGGHVVNYRYGRRGGTLKSGTKTSTPVEFTQAKVIFEKLIKEKIAKGYTPDLAGVAYQGTEYSGRKWDFTPQLPNPVQKEEALRLIEDNEWAAQEKMDGERRAAHADHGTVVGVNRRGLVVPLPQPIADELQRLVDYHGAISVDGEIIGDYLYVFDLHIHGGKCIHALPWIKRMRLAEQLLVNCTHLKPVPVAVSTPQKHALWEMVLAAQGEGLVFKRLLSEVQPGRPNSGGDWLKFKFVESASFCVMAVNSAKRSVKIGLLDGRSGPNAGKAPALIPVGNVTIPPNHDIPSPSDIVEVSYLYAYKGGSIYQPVYRGQRMDLDLNTCTIDQLKFKPNG